MKRLLCFFLCAIVIVCAAGCSAPLTEKEYIEKFSAGAKEYISASNSIIDEFQKGNTETPLFDMAYQALDDIEKLSPPADYKDLHKKLCDAIKDERETLSLLKDSMTIAGKALNGGEVTDEDTEKVRSNTLRLNEITEKAAFSQAMTDILQKYKENDS